MYKTFFISLFILCFHSISSAQTPGELIWEYDVGSYIYSSCAVSGKGNIYLGASDNKLHSISPQGHENWTFSAEDWIDSTPSIGNDGSIYFSSWDNYLYALHPDGSLKWKYLTDGIIVNSALVNEEHVYITGFDGYLYAFDSQTGELQWSYDSYSEINSSPSLSSNQSTLFFADWDGNLHAVNAQDGSERWTYAVDSITDRDYRILASPAIDADGNIYIGSGNYRLYSINKFGALNWYYESDGEIHNQAVIAQNGNIYFGSTDGYIYCLNSSGNLEWKYPSDRVENNSCAIGSDGNIYAVGVINESTSALYCLSPNGDLNWQYDFNRVCDASPLLTADNFIYLGIGNGTLYKIYTGESLSNSHFPQFRQNPQRKAIAEEYQFNYPEWLTNKYGLESALNRYSSDDDDQDGLDLLTEYAIGTNPELYDHQAYIFYSKEDQTFELELDINSRSIEVRIMESTDLDTWAESDALNPELTETKKIYDFSDSSTPETYYHFSIENLITH